MNELTINDIVKNLQKHKNKLIEYDNKIKLQIDSLKKQIFEYDDVVEFCTYTNFSYTYKNYDEFEKLTNELNEIIKKYNENKCKLMLINKQIDFLLNNIG